MRERWGSINAHHRSYRNEIVPRRTRANASIGNSQRRQREPAEVALGANQCPTRERKRHLRSTRRWIAVDGWESPQINNCHPSEPHTHSKANQSAGWVRPMRLDALKANITDFAPSEIGEL